MQMTKKFFGLFLLSLSVSLSAYAIETAPSLKLAENLIKAEHFDKLIEDSIENASLTFNPKLVKKDFPNLSKEDISSAKAKYDNLRPTLNTQALENLKKLIEKNFNEPEINYLINLSQNSLNQRFRNFMNSSDFHNVIDAPYEQASTLIAKAQTKPLTTK